MSEEQPEYFDDYVFEIKVLRYKVNDSITVKWNGRESQCRYCDIKIGWGITASGKKIPFDLEKGYKAHFSTCKQGHLFRGK